MAAGAAELGTTVGCEARDGCGGEREEKILVDDVLQSTRCLETNCAGQREQTTFTEEVL